MKKPYTLVCNSKSKKPHVIGRYTTVKDVEQAYEFYDRKHRSSIEFQRMYPGQGVEDLFCDLEIIRPGDIK